MRRVIFLGILFIVGLCGVSHGQTIETFKARLAQPAGVATVETVEHGSAATVVAQNGQNARRLRLQGYRIGVFFDNGGDARAKALAARRAFEAAFPDVRVYLTYENPYFKVSAGNCATSEEAIVLLGRIRSQFPEAYLMREEMNVADLIR